MVRLALLALALALAAVPALADGVSNAAFPLANGNEVFPARANRLALKCFNPPTNGNVTVAYQSGYTFVMVPGAALWETNRPPGGKITATGTAGQILSCEEVF